MSQQLAIFCKTLEEGNTVDNTLPIKDAKMICSGGIAVGVEPPVLYLDRLEAIDKWQDAMFRHTALAYGGCRMRWLEPPKLERYIITMQDQRGTQRVVSTRYAVLSKLVCVEIENVGEDKSREIPSGDDRVAGSLQS